MVEKKRDPFDAELSFFIGGRRFRDGYELRDVSFKGLRAEESLPPLEEIQRFNQVSSMMLSCSTCYLGQRLSWLACRLVSHLRNWHLLV